MNTVEILAAIEDLAEQKFDAATFPYAFLEAFGNKPTTIKRLKSGTTNSSDIEGGVLQRNNIHIAVCDEGCVTQTMFQLKGSPATKKGKVKFCVATDGIELQAWDLVAEDIKACKFKELAKEFGFFLPLAGIRTTEEIRESTFDIRATGGLNKLYIELLRNNPDWGTEKRRQDMNHFMARLIFCFFAEDTDIFQGDGLFTNTIKQMSERDSSNTHEVMSEIFRTMDTHRDKREKANIPRWCERFPYVNGGLFSGSAEVPRFSKIARSYLIHIGDLDWQSINPDIFGSMIQAVTDEEERSALGLHYTSVPNILKVLNPLFLDELRKKLEDAGESSKKLLNLRKRIAKIRIFDPACGSGNFLVIAYKEMRMIENEINKRRGEAGRKSDIPLTNFRGIEIRDFPAEIARLALIIAEYQCDVLYRNQKEALAEFLPLGKMNWIICGNALRLDWLEICPPTGTEVKLKSDDFFSAPKNEMKIDFENEGGETYICGNPPYIGATRRAPKGASKEMKENFKREDETRKSDLNAIFGHRTKTWRSLDYIAGWFMKAADYGKSTNASTAFVSTNSICQGQQVGYLWPLIFDTGHVIDFSYNSFKWANLASYNAGVVVVIIGLSRKKSTYRRLFEIDAEGKTTQKNVEGINAYLVPGKTIIVEKASSPLCGQATIDCGNMPADGGHLIMSYSDKCDMLASDIQVEPYLYRYIGSQEVIKGTVRYCLWIDETDAEVASSVPIIEERLTQVADWRKSSIKKPTREYAKKPYKFMECRGIGKNYTVIIARISSERRDYLPVDMVPTGYVANNRNFAGFDIPLWNLALIASCIHCIWIGTVCGKLKTDYSYSNTLGWNTFPIPKLTDKNKSDLTQCAEDILLAREAHYPATIADLYDPEKMPENLKRAHEHNDEVLERIYIGRRFKNDTERLEKLFELYTQMTQETSHSKEQVS